MIRLKLAKLMIKTGHHLFQLSEWMVQKAEELLVSVRDQP